MIDLGAWADGTHRVPGDEPASDDAPAENSSD